MSAQILFYAPKHRINEFTDLGWHALGALAGTHHAEYSILVEWPHETSPEFPPADSE